MLPCLPASLQAITTITSTRGKHIYTLQAARICTNTLHGTII